MIKILPKLLKIILKYSFVYKLYFFVNSQNTTALQYGKKDAGCCMHIAAFLNYLCFARFGQNIPLPGEYLNSFLIDMDKQQSPKKPTLVKMKRSGILNSILIIIF